MKILRKTKKPGKNILFFISAILVSGVGIFLFSYFSKSVSAAWFDESWLYRKAISITNSSGSNLTDFQVSFTIDTTDSTKFQSSCNDIRITDNTGKLLPYWIETNNPGCNNSATRIWTKAPSIPTSGATLYIYYGNPIATAYQDGSRVFDFFDDFKTFDTNKWAATGAYSVASDQVTITTGALYSKNTATSQPGYITEAKVNWSNFAEYSGLNIANAQATQGGNAGSNKLVYYMTNTGGSAAVVSYASNGLATGYNINAGTTQFTASAGTNYVIGTAVTDSQVIYYNNRSVTNPYSGTWSGGYYVFLGYFMGSSSGTTNIADINIDWVMARKHASTDPSASLSSEEQGPGPIAYWKLDEGTGTTAKSSVKRQGALDFELGDGADGACTVSSDTNLNSASCAGRGTADAVNFASTANTTSGSTSIVLTATSTGLAVGDEVLIVNLKGAAADYSNVGKYDTKTISSISTTTNPNDTLNFATGLTNTYNGTTQKIMVQRIPNYTTVTVNSTKTLTANAWDGTKGGILFFRATNSVSVSGTLDMTGKGYSGGAIITNGGCSVNSDGQGYGGETYNGYAYRGTSVGGDTPNSTGGAGGGGTDGSINGTTGNIGGGGGGAGWTFGYAGGYGGSGGYGTVGLGLNPGSGPVGGNTTNSTRTGSGGGTYGNANLSTLMLGSGGGGGDLSGGQGPCPGGAGTTFGGNGGGIISINANTITVNTGALIKSNGGATTYGGGGSGGSVKLKGNTLTLSTNLVTATGGTSNGYAGGAGRIALTSSSASGSTNPLATSETLTPSSADGTITNTTWTTEDQCIAGKCLYFNGTDASFTIGGTLNDVKSISFWVKPKTTTQSLIDFDGGTYYISALNGTISATGFDNPTIYVNGKVSSTITANTWQQITVTTSTAFDGSAFKIGNVLTDYLNGFIDEVKVYNYVLNTNQIKAHYLSGKASAESAQGTSGVLGSKAQIFMSDGLVGYWKMDEASGNATDSSGNSTTLTNNSTMAYTGGKFGNSIQCDGTADYLNTATAISNIKTVSFWVYPAAATNNYFINLINSSAYITVNSSGVISGTGFTSPAIYVNGVLNGTATAATWNYVTITTNTGINANAFTVGLTNDGSNHFCTNTSKLDEVRIYNRAFSPKEVSDLYNWAPGPVGYWGMDDKVKGDSKTIVDTSGNGNNGTTVDGANNTGMDCNKVGKYGGGCQFDGTDDYLSLSTPSNFNFNAPATISTWVKTSSDTGQTIFATTESTTINNYQILYLGPVTSFCTNELVTIARVVGGATSYVLCYTTATRTELLDNKWHYLSVTFNGSSVQLYIDGQPKSLTVGSGANDGTFGGITGANDTSIGSIITSSSRAAYLNGTLDDYRFYNYARTQKQIIEDMNASHPAVGSPIASAVGHWDFDEGYGQTVNNSGNGGSTLNGTLGVNSGSSTDDPSWSNSGKFGKALSFDGGDYLIVPDNPGIDLLTSGSISTWAYFNNANDNQSILSKGRGDTNAASYTWSTYGGVLRFDLYMGDGSSNLVTLTTPTSGLSGRWTHLVVSWDGSSLKLYKNGVLQSSTTYSFTRQDTNYSLYFGAENRSPASVFLNGLIDEVKVYNYALAADEVKTEYNKGSSFILGALGNSSSYEKNGANQEYCVPGDTVSSSCAAPTGEWKFEERSGTAANDTSGTGVTANFNGSGLQWVTGKIGSAINITDSTSYLLGADNTNLSASSGQYTLEAWFKSSRPSLNAGDDRHFMVAKGTASNYEYAISMDSNGYLLGENWALNGSGCGNTGYTTTNYGNNKWHHIAFIAKGNGVGLELYVDGKLEKSAAQSCDAGNGTSGIYMGRRGDNPANMFWTGSLDQVRFFNYARSASQIAWDYNKGAPIAHWDFDECQGSVVNDLSGNNNSGTITIGALGEDTIGTCNTSSTVWGSGASGKLNSSLSFDGADDYINFGTGLNSYFVRSKPFSLSTWVKTTLSSAGAIIANADWDSPYVGMQLITGSAGKIQFDFSRTGDNLIRKRTTTGTVNDGNWHHIVLTYNGNGEDSGVSIYLDGIQPATTVDYNTLDSDTTSTTNLQVGARDGTNYPFPGQIDEVKIFNYALSSTQVKNLYNNGAVFYGPSSGTP